MVDEITHVRTQIMTLRGRLDIKETDTYIKVTCPFHGSGRERTPSCGINLKTNGVPVGFFNCLACKAKGPWNTLAETLGLQGFKASDRVNDVFTFSFEESAARKKEQLEDPEKLELWPSGKAWRKITSRTIRKFDGCLPEHRYFSKDDYLYFPTFTNNDYVGGVYARRVVSKQTKDAGLPSYVNTPGKWTNRALFGYNVAKQRKRQPLWLVEGPRDVLKTYQVGGRAVACFGAYFSDRKVRLIEALDPPSIILAFDPDEPGILAREKYKHALRKFPIYDAIFPEGKDPGNLTENSYYKMLDRMGL